MPVYKRPKEIKSKGLAAAAWYSGQSAKNNNKERVVPDNWKKYAEEWYAGYDGVKIDKAHK